MRSIMLFNKIKALKAEMSSVPSDAENRSEQLAIIQGQIVALESELEDALKAEDEARDAVMQTATLVGGVQPAASITEMAFGPRASFEGLEEGFRAAITIPAAPAVTDPTIPMFPDYPRGFADTLTQATTAGAVTYLRRGAKTNAAAQWASGSKAESAYAWTTQTAPLTWIAHHAPISKTQASDWGQLDAIVRSEMMVGLAQTKSRQALVGANASGITGVTNTVGILTHAQASGDNVYDSIRRMATKVLLTSGFFPTHVAMSPQVKESLDLLKGSDGHYLAINVGNQVWSLQIVEDTGLTYVDTAPTPQVHNGAIVYTSVGATWYTKETDNVEMGLVANQFVENAYTLLAEGRNAMAVRFPDAFCYCVDAIPAVNA